jgi:hypothetical protein
MRINTEIMSVTGVSAERAEFIAQAAAEDNVTTAEQFHALTYGRIGEYMRRGAKLRSLAAKAVAGAVALGAIVTGPTAAALIVTDPDTYASGPAAAGFITCSDGGGGRTTDGCLGYPVQPDTGPAAQGGPVQLVHCHHINTCLRKHFHV